MATHLICVNLDGTYCDPTRPEILSSDLRMTAQMLRKNSWKAILTTTRTPALSLTLLVDAAVHLQKSDPDHWKERLELVKLSSHFDQFDAVRSPLHLLFLGSPAEEVTDALCQFENDVVDFICKHPENFTHLLLKAYQRLDQERYVAPSRPVEHGFKPWQDAVKHDAEDLCKGYIANSNHDELLALLLVTAAKGLNSCILNPDFKIRLMQSLKHDSSEISYIDSDPDENSIIAEQTGIVAYKYPGADFRHNVKAYLKVDLEGESRLRAQAVVELEKYVRSLPLKSKDRGHNLIQYVQNPDKTDWREIVKANIAHYDEEASGTAFKEDPDLRKGFKTRPIKGWGQYTFHATLKRVEAIIEPQAPDAKHPEMHAF